MTHATCPLHVKTHSKLRRKYEPPRLIKNGRTLWGLSLNRAVLRRMAMPRDATKYGATRILLGG